MAKDKESIFADGVWNYIAGELKKRDVNQAWLVRRCQEVGMPILQPELSKLYNKKKKINIYELAAISKALDMPMDYLVYGKAEKNVDILNTQNSSKLLCDANTEQFKAYLGEYHIYYNVTDDDRPELKQSGTLTVAKDSEGFCSIKLKIRIGSTGTVKTYEGRMLITTVLSGAYLILKNDALGELCFMILRHRNFTVKQMECRLALCLTIGSGENKLPTAHKMILSRSNLSEEQLTLIEGYMNLYGKGILIEQGKANELVQHLSSEKEQAKLKELWKVLSQKRYYEVSIELLRRTLNLDRKEFARFIAELLKAAESESYVKVYDGDDSLLYSVIGDKTENDAEPEVVSKKVKSGIPPD
ncbi:MAG: hypothetical protein Q4D94_09350 [Bacillota bacterium]|nr:hypothetical protein [Bacillota bacterium]